MEVYIVSSFHLPKCLLNESHIPFECPIAFVIVKCFVHYSKFTYSKLNYKTCLSPFRIINAIFSKIPVALQALKKKKRLEKQLQQIDGTLSTIEMQREALESANTNTAVLTTMKNAADALKAAHQNM